MDHRVYCPTNHLAVRVKMSVTEIWRKVCKNCEICDQLFFERLKEVMQYVGICRELEWMHLFHRSSYSSVLWLFYVLQRVISRSDLFFLYKALILLSQLLLLCKCYLTQIIFSLYVFDVSCTVHTFFFFFFSGRSQSSSTLLMQTPLKAAILKLAQQKKCIL